MYSAETLGSAQATRLGTLPRQTIAPSPLREVALEGVRQRNAVLDYVFYDLGVLSADEGASLAPTYAAEGAILVVGPSAQPSLRIWPDFETFRETGPGDVRTLAVAGVGSSALGAAAFARNIADATGAPVMAVVSGYGLSDLLTEALGGFFLFGYVNSLRHMFEPLDTLMRPGLPSLAGSSVSTIRRSLDVKTIMALFESGYPCDLLIGHSKGNLVLSEALYALKARRPGELSALADRADIVTVSARIAMPVAFRSVVDVMGALDGFGAMNSRLDIAVDVPVRGAWHHTNTELPMHLPVTEILRDRVLPGLKGGA